MKRVLALLFTLAMVFSCVVFANAATGDAEATSGAPSSLALMDGASVRLSETQSGLRFETRILTSELEALGADVVIGTLILPTDLVTGEITASSPSVLDLNTDMAGVSTTVDGDYTVFYAAIVDILPQNYARAFSARSYVKVGGTYYYTAYSAAKNSRSVYGVAVDAWEGSYKDNAIVKAYLDKVVVINGSMQLSKTIKGYTSPYNVSYASNVITVTATDGTLVEGDIATMIVDYNGRIFTRGWTISDNTLTAPYSAKLSLVQTFDGITQAGTTGGYNKNNFWTNGNSGLTLSIANGTAIQTKPYEASSAKTYPKMMMTSNVANAIGETNDTLIYTMSFKIPEGCTEIQRASFRLCKSAYNDGQVALGATGANLVMKQNAVYVASDVWQAVTPEAVVTYLSSTDWVDLSLVIDFVDSEMDIYVNGVLVRTMTLASTINLDYAKLMTRAAMYIEFTHFQNTQGSWGIEIDSFSWGVTKTH